MEGGIPATTGNSGDDGASAESQQQPPPQTHENGGGGGGFELGDRNSSGNRWPKQETLAMIKIRSEMDTAFRDSNLKGPLWDNVSRFFFISLTFFTFKIPLFSGEIYDSFFSII